MTVGPHQINRPPPSKEELKDLDELGRELAKQQAAMNQAFAGIDKIGLAKEIGMASAALAKALPDMKMLEVGLSKELGIASAALAEALPDMKVLEKAAGIAEMRNTLAALGDMGVAKFAQIETLRTTYKPEPMPSLDYRYVGPVRKDQRVLDEIRELRAEVREMSERRDDELRNAQAEVKALRAQLHRYKQVKSLDDEVTRPFEDGDFRGIGEN